MQAPTGAIHSAVPLVFEQKQSNSFEKTEFYQYLVSPHKYSVESVMAFPEYKGMIAADECVETSLSANDEGLDGGVNQFGLGNGSKDSSLEPQKPSFRGWAE